MLLLLYVLCNLSLFSFSNKGDLAECKRKNNSQERELSYEMRQKALLEAKVDNLQKQLKQQMAKFTSLQEDSFNVTKDGSHHKAEVGKLKATVRNTLFPMTTDIGGKIIVQL